MEIAFLVHALEAVRAEEIPLRLDEIGRAARLPVAMALGLTALFALTHGVAHGLELPALASPWGYAAGFVAATAALHGAGYALVRWLPQAAAPLVRVAGAASAGAGLWLLGS